jgi:RNA polymerase sigma-70 factor, ECF subfamily
MFQNFGVVRCGLNKAMAEDFERIVREYQNKVFRLALGMLGDRTAAEEAAQDVLVRVWKGLPAFRGESSLSTWIYSITRNACLTALRRREISAVSLDDPAPRHEAEKRTAAEWSIAASPDVAALLERLPVKYRQVVALFYMQEKSYDEVARMLDLPVGTVKTYLFRARKSLAEEMVRERVEKGGA